MTKDSTRTRAASPSLMPYAADGAPKRVPPAPLARRAQSSGREGCGPSSAPARRCKRLDQVFRRLRDTVALERLEVEGGIEPAIVSQRPGDERLLLPDLLPAHFRRAPGEPVCDVAVVGDRREHDGVRLGPHDL